MNWVKNDICVATGSLKASESILRWHNYCSSHPDVLSSIPGRCKIILTSTKFKSVRSNLLLNDHPLKKPGRRSFSPKVSVEKKCCWASIADVSLRFVSFRSRQKNFDCQLCRNFSTTEILCSLKDASKTFLVGSSVWGKTSEKKLSRWKLRNWRKRRKQMNREMQTSGWSVLQKM